MEVSAAPATTSTTSTASPRSNPFSVEERLNLSLDALIKERKKETKKEIQDKKRQSVKTETTAKTATTKQDKTKEKQNQQQKKRKALANKNRGLESLHEPKKDTSKKKNAKKIAAKKQQQQPAIASKKSKKNLKAPAPAKVMPVATAAAKKKAKKPAQVTNAKQKATTSKSKQQQQSPKKKQQQVVVQPYTIKKVKQQPGLSPKSVQKQPERRVTQASRKGNKLQVTIRRVEMKQQPNAKKQKQDQSKKRPVKAILPGKTPKAMAKMQRAQHVVKRVQSHKQTSKNGKFIVRKPFMARK